jgi:periplasmic divalent cation tolerance protein
MSECLLVLMTAGSHEEADRLAGALVSGRLAACVNIVPGITSVYRWEGEVHRDQEWLLLAKSHRDALDELVQCVHTIHSYEVPEIVALSLVGGSQAYLSWIEDVVLSND